MKRTRSTPYRTLYKKARSVFARWIVQRDPKCITCGRPSAHAGHYIHRNCYDFNEQLNNGQCVYCNLYQRGNLSVYTLKMIDKYGYDQVQDWHKQSHEIIKFSREFLENIIKKYGVNQ